MSKREPVPEQRYGIEHGVPIPKSKREIAAVLEKMKVGDSFSIVHDTIARRLKRRSRRVLGRSAQRSPAGSA